MKLPKNIGKNLLFLFFFVSLCSSEWNLLLADTVELKNGKVYENVKAGIT